MGLATQVDHIGRLYKLMQVISDIGYDYAVKSGSQLKDITCLKNKLRYLIAANRTLSCFKVPNQPAYSYGSFRLRILGVPAQAITITVYVDGVEIGTSTTTLADIYTDIVTAINSATSTPDYTAKYDNDDKIYITAAVTGEVANGKKVNILLSNTTAEAFEITNMAWGHDDYDDDYNCLTQDEVDTMWNYIGIIANVQLPPYGSNWTVPNIIVNTTNYFLLKDSGYGGYILQEDGTRIILE